MFLYTLVLALCVFFFFNDTATTEIYTLSLHDALPISVSGVVFVFAGDCGRDTGGVHDVRLRSEEHTSELQSLYHLVCPLLLGKRRHMKEQYSQDLGATLLSPRATRVRRE